MTSGERQTRLRGPELVSRRTPASDKGSTYRRACFDAMPNSTVSSAVLMTGRRRRRSAICRHYEQREKSTDFSRCFSFGMRRFKSEDGQPARQRLELIGGTVAHHPRSLRERDTDRHFGRKRP